MIRALLYSSDSVTPASGKKYLMKPQLQKVSQLERSISNGRIRSVRRQVVRPLGSLHSGLAALSLFPCRVIQYQYEMLQTLAIDRAAIAK